MDWSYFATKVNGDGTETLLGTDLPLSDVQVTDALSAPDQIDFVVKPEVSELAQMFVPWSTAVYAVKDDVIRHGSIVTRRKSNDSELSVTSLGFSAYPNGLPWTNSTLRLYDVDPAYVIRLIWERIQMHPRGNIGMTLNTISTPVRVGVKVPALTDTLGEVQEEARDEPLLLANYATTDLGQMLDALHEAGSIDYREVHTWGSSGLPVHSLLLGHPRLGRRRTDIVFDIGTNCAAVPEIDEAAEDYGSEILLLCAGEGDKMIRAHAYNPSAAGRLRRVQVQLAKGIGRQTSAVTAAANRAKALSNYTLEVSEITVVDHPNAPMFSWEVGDEVLLRGHAGWAGEIELWVRVMETTYKPQEAQHLATLRVVPANKIGADYV